MSKSALEKIKLIKFSSTTFYIMML